MRAELDAASRMMTVRKKEKMRWLAGSMRAELDVASHVMTIRKKRSNDMKM